MYSVMWSEHCSYKSSKVWLRQFGQKVTPEMKKNLMVGMGENAGVIDIGEGWAVTFKIESHNHPSYIEPFQGAATGVGGIVRDIISMGARPVAVMDALRFGAIDHPDTARVRARRRERHQLLRQLPRPAEHRRRDLVRPDLPGEPARQRARGRRAAPRGPAPRQRPRRRQQGRAVRRPHRRRRHRRRDRILASDTFSEGGPTKRPAVQVGDPFAEKVLIECCLELFAGDLVEGIQDLGAAGISCATSELASNGDGGMAIELDKVLLRDPTLTAEEILMSESQERMMAIVEPGEARGLPRGHRASGMSRPACSARSPTPAASSSPGAARRSSTSTRAPSRSTARSTSARSPTRAGSTRCRPTRASVLPAPPRARRSRPSCSPCSAAPNLADKSWITNQYDRYVLGNTALSYPDDGGMVRVDEKTGLGFAVATDANGRYCYLDPYQGAQLALAEAYRNVAVDRCDARSPSPTASTSAARRTPR